MAGGDPYFNSVQLLLHCNGANAGTTFTDSSAAARTPTITGTAQTSTAVTAKFGSACLKVNGTSGYLTYSSGIDFGTSDFTVEGWAYATAPASGYMHVLLGYGTGYHGASGFALHYYYYTAGSSYYLSVNQGTSYGASVAMTNGMGTWFHFALVRASGVVSLFYNGVKAVSNIPNTSLSSKPFRLGFHDMTYDSNGTTYLDDVRVTIGSARYTADFSPPTAAFPDFYGSTVDDVLAVPYWIRHRTDSSLITDVAQDGSGGVWALREVKTYG